MTSVQQAIIYQARAIKAISELVEARSPDDDVCAEAMRALGRINYPALEKRIFMTLIEALNNSSPLIRDSAALALGDLGDPAAIEYLKERIKLEKYDSIKQDFEQIIEDLST